jgi:hypothetical protein
MEYVQSLVPILNDFIYNNTKIAPIIFFQMGNLIISKLSYVNSEQSLRNIASFVSLTNIVSYLLIVYFIFFISFINKKILII